MSGPATSSPRRSLLAVIARRARRHGSRRALVGGLLRAVGITLLAALLAAPFAVLWGVGHASIHDYLGPHRVTFASNYDGEIEIDLGPIGNAYLPSPRAPVGLDITVGGVAAADGGQAAPFLSEQTLTEYAGLVSEPEEAVAGIVERLVRQMVVASAEAELVLLALFAAWVLRREVLSPRLVRAVRRRPMVGAYLMALALLAGSLAAPPAPTGQRRIPVTASLGRTFSGLTVDSLLLSDLLDRAIKGITLLTRRQRQIIDDYITQAGDQLAAQVARLPEPRVGETMLMGFSDLHCNQAMTRLLIRLADITTPAQILDSGDDTVNGTAAERFCITREAAIGGGVPFTVSPGNHDSDVTTLQLKGANIAVLDGQVIDSGGLRILGDSDPERQIPFSHERVQDRPESETQLGQRMVRVARTRAVDVVLVHQPTASLEMMTTPDPPARLVVWGHYHQQQGPTVVVHGDGTWTVGMQEGTAGGVRQPTISSFSTPFSPPLISADVYFYYRDNATGLITGVQAVHFLPDASVVVAARVETGNPSLLPAEVRDRLRGSTPTPDRPR